MGPRGRQRFGWAHDARGADDFECDCDYDDDYDDDHDHDHDHDYDYDYDYGYDYDYDGDSMIEVEAHPSLYVRAFESRFPAPLGQCPTPSWLREMLGADFRAPVTRSEETRRLVRDVFRHGGYKPTGRGKPAAEYLVKAATEERLRSINAAVDAGNVVSLHSGLPVSLVDADRATPPLGIAIVRDDRRFVFNAAGQQIRLTGLVCLWDRDGPCANGIKDSQRTKTTAATSRTLSVVWGARELTGQTDRAVSWYRELVVRLGAETASVELQTVA